MSDKKRTKAWHTLRDSFLRASPKKQETVAKQLSKPEFAKNFEQGEVLNLAGAFEGRVDKKFKTNLLIEAIKQNQLKGEYIGTMIDTLEESVSRVFPLFDKAITSGDLTDVDIITSIIINTVSNSPKAAQVDRAFNLAQYVTSEGIFTKSSDIKGLAGELSERLSKLHNTKPNKQKEFQTIIDNMYDEELDRNLDDALSQWNALTNDKFDGAPPS